MFIVLVIPSVSELNEPSDAAMAVPAPFAPGESIKNSAAAILCAVSVAVAVSVVLTLVRSGDTDGVDVVGATVSIAMLL